MEDQDVVDMELEGKIDPSDEEEGSQNSSESDEEGEIGDDDEVEDQPKMETGALGSESENSQLNETGPENFMQVETDSESED